MATATFPPHGKRAERGSVPHWRFRSGRSNRWRDDQGDPCADLVTFDDLGHASLNQDAERFNEVI
jgi:hypothetical protein